VSQYNIPTHTPTEEQCEPAEEEVHGHLDKRPVEVRPG